MTDKKDGVVVQPARGRPRRNGAGQPPDDRRRLPGRRAGGAGPSTPSLDDDEPIRDSRSLRSRASASPAGTPPARDWPQSENHGGNAPETDSTGDDPTRSPSGTRAVATLGSHTGAGDRQQTGQNRDGNPARDPQPSTGRRRRRSPPADGQARDRRAIRSRRNDNSGDRQQDPRGLRTGRSGRTLLTVSDATVARAGAALLWVLVIVAAYGGVTAWLQSGGDGSTSATPPAPGDIPDGRWYASGFAERYVTAYLQAGSEGAQLAPFLGYTPDLPPTAEPTTDATVRTVGVVPGEDGRDGYWAVTVASTTTDGTTESFWQVGVDTSTGQPVAAGLPAPIAAPPNPAQTDLAVNLRQPPGGDPMVESVEGFLAAYLCGAPDLDRYIHPDYPGGPAALTPADPPACRSVDVIRWGATPIADGRGPDRTVQRPTVVAEVELDTGSRAHRATYSFTLAQRDERWEVAALLPAPPIEER